MTENLIYYEGYTAALRTVCEWFSNPTYKPDLPTGTLKKLNAILACMAENPDVLMRYGCLTPIEWVVTETGRNKRISARICEH